MNAPAMVIIGAGHAAVRAALSLRSAGYDGAVTMVADEGINAPYERPVLSKWRSDNDLHKPIIPDDQLADAGVNRVKASVSSIDPVAHQITLDDGAVVQYSRLLLATGASARRLDTDFTKDATLHYLRDIADATTLRQISDGARSAIIIGGGFIGLELAASLRGMDVDVHVLEVADRLLARGVSIPVAQIVQRLHEAHGVTFHFGCTLMSCDAGQVTLSDGRTLCADLIIAGIGSAPNTVLAESAGLAVQNGITVNTHLQTSAVDIFAAGDCCCFPLYGAGGPMTRLESWQAAGEQGALAARNMVGPTQTGCTLTPWFWSEQYDHVLQVSGLMGSEAEQTERAYDPSHHVTFGFHGDRTLAFACGIAPGTKVAKDIRFAAKMIEAGSVTDPEKFSDPAVTLKSLLRG